MTMELKALDFSGRYLPPGEVIADRFKLAEQLGEGPFGQVYRADDMLIESSVAIKLFAGDLLANPLEEEHFLKTTRKARALTQKNVVRLHDSGIHKGHPWVSMQQLEGLNLRKVSRLREEKGVHFRLEEIEPLISQITLALQHVARDFPHGDLKPENVIFLPDLIKVTDSYLFDAIPSGAFAKGNSDNPFIAPELQSAGGGTGDQRCDVYSVGALIGYLLYGEEYEPGTYAGDDGALRAVDGLCRRAMAFDPGERYGSVERLNEDFTSIVDTGMTLLPSGKMAGLSAKGIAGPKAPPSAPLAPPAPPMGGPARRPLDVETPRDIAKPLQEDLTTREFQRDGTADLGDLLPTNEVDRTQFPAPREEVKRPRKPPVPSPAVTAPREATQTVARKPETGKASPGGSKKETSRGTIALVLVAMVLVAVGLAYITRDAPIPPAAPMTEPQAQVTGQEDGFAEPEAPEAVEEEVSEEGLNDALSAATEGLGEGALDAARGAAQERARELEEERTAEEQAEEQAETEPEPPAEGTEVAAARPPQEETRRRPAPEPTPAPRAGTDCPSAMVLVRSGGGNVCVDTYEYPGGGRRPQVNVSWFDANRICEEQGKRLCELSEWRAACGTNYPYGRAFDPVRCNTADEDGFERSLAVAGSFPGCQGPTGTYDMSGNVHEWVQERRVAGGGYDSDADLASCRYSSPKAPGSTDPNVGFRCCADPQ